MDQEIKTAWVTALRSGEYKQAQGFLKRGYDDGSVNYCCLGVLCEVVKNFGIEFNSEVNLLAYDAGTYTTYDGQQGSLPMEVSGRADISPNGQFVGVVAYESPNDGKTYDANSLVDLNDSAKWNFDKIADMIEEKF